MLKQIALVPLCGVWLGACAPGPVLRSPAIVGAVTNAQTHLPLAGARVRVIIPGDDSSAHPLPDTVSDAQGDFLLAAQYRPSLMFNIGHPRPTPMSVEISKDGYGGYVLKTAYNLHVPPFEPLHVEGELEPAHPPQNTHL